MAPARRHPGAALGIVTPTGWGVAGAAVVLAVISGVLRFAELSVLAVGCVAALLAAAVAVAYRPRLSAEIEVLPARVRRGEAAMASVTIRNIADRRSGVLQIILPHGETATETPLRSLGGSTRRTIAVPLPTARRGVLRVGPVHVRRSDPFGLLARSQQVGEAAVVHVHPVVHPLTPLASARSSSPDGLSVDSRTEGGVTFHALREYVPGDDPRHVHWRSSARAGTLLVRRHVDPSEPVTTVLLDTRAYAYPSGAAGDGAFDAAVDVAASVLFASARRRFPVRLRTTGDVRVAGRGGRGDDQVVLDALARVERDAGTLDAAGFGSGAGAGAGAGLGVAAYPDDALTAAVRGLGRGGVGTLTLVTGGVDVGQAAAVAPAVSRFEHVIVVRVGGTGVDSDSADSTRAPAAAGGGRLHVLDVADAAALVSVWPATSAGRMR
ncbi:MULTISPECIES: DUF58 domain-containing protein [unclassified Frankia]|uniref:DUF58 domain-containing protein n=1 Tax=unclassified Frankia TaxID=2632575 RepID=UPI002AD28EC0|nr:MULTISPECIES: DUF58 domain-containing protein [unclassified Frankia]